MVEVGSITIGGKVDTQAIERGMKTIQDKFDDVKDKVQQGQERFQDLANTAKNAGKTLTAIGGVGVGAVTTLATQAPATADEMAKMRVQMVELGFVAGEILEPAFKFMANSLLPGFVNFLKNNKGTIKNVLGIIGDIGKAILFLSTFQFGKLANLIGGGGSSGPGPGGSTGFGTGPTDTNAPTPQDMQEIKKMSNQFLPGIGNPGEGNPLIKPATSNKSDRRQTPASTIDIERFQQGNNGLADPSTFDLGIQDVPVLGWVYKQAAKIRNYFEDDEQHRAGKNEAGRN